MKNAVLREAITLPTPKHRARLVLALLHALHLRRVSRRRRVLASLQAGIAAVVVRPVLAPDLARQRALVAGVAARRRRARADDRVRADGRIRRRRCVQPVRLLQRVLALPLHAVRLRFLRPVRVDRFLCEVVRAAAGGDERRPAVAVVGLVVCLFLRVEQLFACCDGLFLHWEGVGGRGARRCDVLY